MMELILYKVVDVMNVGNKNLSSPITYNINLPKKDEIVEFTIMIESETDLISNKYNYAYISSPIQRYYYVSNIVALSKNLFKLYLVVDVIQTYLPQIKQFEEQVKTQSVLTNKEIISSNEGLISGENGFILVTIGKQGGID